MMSKRWIWILALTLPTLTSCGGATAIDPAAAESLQQQVRDLAAVTQERNFALALEQAEALKTDVANAETAGTVTPGRAARIQDNINGFIESIQPAEAPAPATPSADPAPAPETSSAEPAPAPPTFTPPPRNVREDSKDPGESQREREREAAEEAQKEAEKAAEEQQKREEKERKDDDD